MLTHCKYVICWCLWVLVLLKACNDTPVCRHIAIFFATIRISYIEQGIVIFTTHLHMHQQRFLVLMHDDFQNNLTRKIQAEQCLALYSRWRTQETHACFHVQFQYDVCYRNKPLHSNTLLVLLLCNVSYRIVTTVSGYVSYRGKMYRCRPTLYLCFIRATENCCERICIYVPLRLWGPSICLEKTLPVIQTEAHNYVWYKVKLFQ